MGVFEAKFSDMLSFDQNERTVISTRDGVSEYLGLELGLEPADKKFLVYRSPAVIANLARLMPGIPVIDGHQMLDGKASTGPEGGKVESSEFIDLRDESYYSTMAVKNKITLTDEMLALVKAGKRGLSVDGTAKMADADPRIPIPRDFDILSQIPEHLAICEPGTQRQGRFMQFVDSKAKEGKAMKFADKLKNAISKKVLCDAEGNALTLGEIGQIMNDLPELIQTYPIGDLEKVFTPIRDMLAKVKGATGAKADDEDEVADEEPTEEEKKKAAEEKKANDEKKVADAVNAQVLKVVDARVAEHGAVITRAMKFLPDTYDFAGKSTAQVMRDALVTVTDKKFADSELKPAFDVAQPRAPGSVKMGDQATDLVKLFDTDF